MVPVYCVSADFTGSPLPATVVFRVAFSKANCMASKRTDACPASSTLPDIWVPEASGWVRA